MRYRVLLVSRLWSLVSRFPFSEIHSPSTINLTARLLAFRLRASFCGYSLVEVAVMGAVDEERLPGRETRFGQAEELDGSGDVLGVAQTAVGNRPGSVGEPRLLSLTRPDRHVAGSDAVDADTVWAELEGHVPGHRLDARLSQVVDGRVLVAGMHADRADIDDSAPDLPADHLLRHVLGEDVGRADIDVDLVVPLLVGHVPEVATDAHAGVIDQDVDLRDGGHRCLREAVRLRVN